MKKKSKRRYVCFICGEIIDIEDRWLYATDNPYKNRYVHRTCFVPNFVHLKKGELKQWETQ